MRLRPVLVGSILACLASPPLISQVADSGRPVNRYTMVQTGHAMFLGGTTRALLIANGRLDNGRTLDWDRVARRTRAASAIETDLTLKERLLESRLGSTEKNEELQRLIDRRRGNVARLLERLSSRSPAPLAGADAFTAANATALPSGPPRTAAQVRVYLKTAPIDSLDDLFGATAGVPRGQLPTRGTR